MAIALDIGSLALSVVGDALLVGCVVATEGGCALIAVGVKGADFVATGVSTAYALDQYYAKGASSDVDLAVALTDVFGVIPGVGEVSGILSLGWDLADPLVPDETYYSPGVAI